MSKIKVTPELRRELHESNQKFPPHLVLVPREQWPRQLPTLLEVWRSRTFVVQVYKPRDGVQQVSVNRSSLGDDGRWRDGVTWDELMELKRQIGREHRWAVEVYPDAREVMNVANMRHLWLLDGPPAWAWQPTQHKTP